MAKYNRVCHTCPTKYYYCPTCPDDNRDPQIYTMFCSERCKSIFLTLAENGSGKADLEVCKQKLLDLNVTENEKMLPHIREHFNKVMASDLAKEIEEIKEEVVVKPYVKDKKR